MDEKLSLEQLNVDLYNGTGTVSNIALYSKVRPRSYAINCSASSSGSSARFSVCTLQGYFRNPFESLCFVYLALFLVYLSLCLSVYDSIRSEIGSPTESFVRGK